jgi:hypothetical protein
MSDMKEWKRHIYRIWRGNCYTFNRYLTGRAEKFLLGVASGKCGFTTLRASKYKRAYFLGYNIEKVGFWLLIKCSQ